jgi:hypothetical protein
MLNATHTHGGRALGFASIAIGLTEITAPAVVQSLLGIDDHPVHRGILRVLGVREILHGFSLLTEKQPTSQLCTSLWARVAGDMLDTALLGLAATKTKSPSRFVATSASVMAIGLADFLSAKKGHRHSHRQYTS